MVTPVYLLHSSLAQPLKRCYMIHQGSSPWLVPLWPISLLIIHSAHVYFSPLSVDCRSIGRPTYRSTVDRLSTECLPTVGRPIGRLSPDSRLTVGRQSIDLSADCRPTVSRHAVSRPSADSRSTVGWLSASGLSPEILQYHLKNKTGRRFRGGADSNTRLHGIWVKTCSNVTLKNTRRVTKMRRKWFEFCQLSTTAGRHCRTISCLNLVNIPAISGIKRWHCCLRFQFFPLKPANLSRPSIPSAAFLVAHKAFLSSSHEVQLTVRSFSCQHHDSKSPPLSYSRSTVDRRSSSPPTLGRLSVTKCRPTVGRLSADGDHSWEWKG